MHTPSVKSTLVFAIALMAALPVLADPPSWAGKGKGTDREDRGSVEGEVRSGHFTAKNRVAVRDYYNHEFKGRGKCPPGLAKRHNGCMPPGQARKWQLGEALPSDVKVYPVPQELEIRIGLPPAGYKYVRVASDILMIATGTSIVADAIKDLGKL